MARTLGCLVASMTIGAVVLDWVQPNTVATATPSIGLMAPLNGGRSEWRSIHVVPHRTQGAGQSRETHWVVDREGKATPTEVWKSKRHLMPGGEIRVSLVAPANSNQITPRQWSRAQELIATLQRDFQIGQRTPDTVVDDTLDLPKVVPSRPRS